MSAFGELLRKYRQNSKDPASSKQLSQERLGELLGSELGIMGRYTGAAVSDWERDKSKIHADDRRILIGLVKVLYKQGGLNTIAEASELLETGNYRDLSLLEKRQIFPQTMIVDVQMNSPIDPKHPGLTAILQEQVLDGILGEKIKARLAEAEDGPQPAWPRKMIAIVNVVTEGWTAFHILSFLGWAWVWLLSFWVILPSLRWPFTNKEQAFVVMVMYGAGALVLPTLIGALTITKNNPFWQKHSQAKERIVRLYTHQGAGVGFFLGYMAIFAVHLIIYYLGLRLNPLPQTLLEALEVTFLLVISYGCARLVPYNLWKAFKRLDLTDGGIFFVFLGTGPLWGFVFYSFYPFLLDPITGLIMILVAFTLIALAQARRYVTLGDKLDSNESKDINRNWNPPVIVKDEKKVEVISLRSLKLFLCYASADKFNVVTYYKNLLAEGIDVWFDKEKLLPGQHWEFEIPKAVRDSDVVLVCLSAKSVNKEGYIQKEIKLALDVADEKPEGTIFIIPVRLEDCKVPDRLRRYHWVDLFEGEGYRRLIKALNVRANQVGAGPCKSSAD